MSNFIYLEGKKPINLDLVKYILLNERCRYDSIFGWTIEFVFANEEDPDWWFETEEERDAVYEYILKKHCTLVDVCVVVE